jgi:hypothetical protein
MKYLLLSQASGLSGISVVGQSQRRRESVGQSVLRSRDIAGACGEKGKQFT